MKSLFLGDERYGVKRPINYKSTYRSKKAMSNQMFKKVEGRIFSAATDKSLFKKKDKPTSEE